MQTDGDFVDVILQ